MTTDVIAILRELVAIPSVSGHEQAAVDFVAGRLAAAGREARIIGRNVVSRIGGEGPALLFNSHLDTVPASAEWTHDPFEPHDPTPADGRVDRIMGLGANDAKSSCAAMLAAYLDARHQDLGGPVVLALTCDEETGGQGLEAIVPELGPLAAAVVGEPSSLIPARAQRGMARLRLRARGRRGHASRPWEGINAIQILARDIAALEALAADGLAPVHPLLGPVTLTPTLIEGGVAKNVIPPEASCVLDARTTPECPNDRLIARVRASCASELEILSDRFVPLETPADDPLVRAARAAVGSDVEGRFLGVSDLLFVRHVPGVVLGPGHSAQSHVADEFVEVAQVLAAHEAYGRIMREYRRGDQP